MREERREVRPRAYESDVEAAALKYGVDPNLLFAVMRVESVYHRQIVSHAGAIGLMQIMPRTGRLISRELGVEDFDTIDLLNPRTNLEFAAWYLSSLIKRFDGRLPLAIASYNGGPHNVRVWMSGYPPTMPLDAFLERIPFEETHRYVRRVLTHYAAYRAQQNLPMAKLSVELPKIERDEVAF
jgi:soluble lytic murein transglycosylase